MIQLKSLQKLIFIFITILINLTVINVKTVLASILFFSSQNFKDNETGQNIKGYVTGQFTGNDNDGDKFISKSEIESFNLAWVSNTPNTIKTFTLALNDLNTFSYSLEENEFSIRTQIDRPWALLASKNENNNNLQIGQDQHIPFDRHARSSVVSISDNNYTALVADPFIVNPFVKGSKITWDLIFTVQENENESEITKGTFTIDTNNVKLFGEDQIPYYLVESYEYTRPFPLYQNDPDHTDEYDAIYSLEDIDKERHYYSPFTSDSLIILNDKDKIEKKEWISVIDYDRYDETEIPHRKFEINMTLMTEGKTNEGSWNAFHSPLPQNENVISEKLFIPVISENQKPESYTVGTWLAVARPIPEPLTILGTGTAIAFGVGFKYKLAKAKSSR